VEASASLDIQIQEVMMHKVSQLRALVIAAAVVGILFAVQPARSQVLYGSMVGNVSDESRAVVPGATVKITHTETNESREGQTNDVGVYSFATIFAGTYEVVISKAGFQTATRRGVAVTTNSVVRVDVMLRVGEVSQNIMVTGEAAVLQTDRADVRSEMSSATLANVPVSGGRNFQQLFVTLPGFTPPDNAYSFTSNPTRSLAIHANGTTREGNDVRIDGATANNIWLQTLAAYIPALDAIETVNVSTNSFDAEQGLAGGAAVNVQVKSGTNKIHGSAFEYHADNAMMAKAFFLPVGQRKPKSIDNDFGGTIGGPIKKDKLFYFFSYDGFRMRRIGGKYLTVPTAAIRAGDMSASPTLIYDPSTGNADGSGRIPFSNKQVPQIDPIVKKIVDLVPAPTWPDLLTNNFYGSGTAMFNRHTIDGKVNYHWSDKLSFAARIGWVNFIVDDPPVFGEKLGGTNVGFAGQPAKGSGSIYSNTFSGLYLLSPTFVIDGYFGLNKFRDETVNADVDKDIGLDFLGIPGTNGGPRLGGWPNFNVTNYGEYGQVGGNVPWYHHNDQYQYVANANWTKGSHNVRFGIDTINKQLNTWEFNAPQGAFSFSGAVTTIKGGSSPNQFNSYAQFLLGLPSSWSKGMQPEDKTSRALTYGLFLRDQWQVARKLTVDYGLRWEYHTVPTRKDRGLERYDPNTNKQLVCGVGSIPTDCGYHFSKKQFAPRLGIAYRVSPGFVIRAGYGISWTPFNIGQQLLSNYPAKAEYAQSGVNSYQPVDLLKNGIPLLSMPSLGNGIIDVPGTVTVTSLPDNYVRSYVQSWNFTLQKELGWGFVGQAGYVATRQVHQQYSWDMNGGRFLGAGQAGQPLVQRWGRTASTTIWIPMGHSLYDSLQATLQRRFAGGYQLMASYTWSKTIALCCNIKQDGGVNIQNPDYWDLNRAVAAFDRTQVFTMSGVAELPFGRGKRWLGDAGPVGAAIVSGWQLNSLFSAYTGLPFTVSASSTSLNMPSNSQQADQIKPNVAILGGVGATASYFDPLAYAPVTQARFGNSGLMSMRGPGLVNLDLGLFRNFRVTETMRIQFRAEAFNSTNTPHFSNPGTNVSNLQLNADGSVKNLGGFSVITSTTGTGREGVDQRVFRLGLRVSF
jgi:hypothetical protein